MIPILPNKVAVLNSILNITVRYQLHTFSLIVSRNHASLASNTQIRLSLRGRDASSTVINHVSTLLARPCLLVPKHAFSALRAHPHGFINSPNIVVLRICDTVSNGVNAELATGVESLRGDADSALCGGQTLLAAGDLAFMALSAFWEEALSAFLADILGTVISVKIVRWDVTVENGLLTPVTEVGWEPVSLALVASFLSWAAGAVIETESGSIAWSASS